MTSKLNARTPSLGLRKPQPEQSRRPAIYTDTAARYRPSAGPLNSTPSTSAKGQTASGSAYARTPTKLGPSKGHSRSNKQPLIHHITPPDGTKIAIFGDNHIGEHDEDAHKVLIECFEHEGVDLVIPNGDVHDCGPVSPHLGKQRAAALKNGQLAEEAASGRWIVDWLMTRPCIMGTGNHEDWINDVALSTNTVGSLTVASALGLPVGPDFIVLPHGYQIRIGSLVVEHGDIVLGRSTGGVHLASRILAKYPNQTTIVNHFHHSDYTVATTVDRNGILVSHAAHALGHMSDPNAHTEYAGRAPNWQQGGAIVQIWYDEGKPRYTINQIEIHRDRRGRPIFEYGGKVYR